MTAERTPFAVLMTALGESLGLPSPAAPNSGPNKPAPSNPVAQQQCTQKKRKRTVACGHCDACGRDDCGTCLNCLDKPKFGGQGIRKQSCLERKCRFPTSATITTLTVSTPDEPTYAEPRAPPKPANRDRQEWDEFWGAVDCCMRLQSSPNLGSTVVESFDHANKKTRSARCGGCQGCVRGDCGDCKNCLDKPKFGGRGIKKQACLSRVCCNPQEDGVESPGGLLSPLRPRARGTWAGEGGGGHIPSPYPPPPPPPPPHHHRTLPITAFLPSRVDHPPPPTCPHPPPLPPPRRLEPEPRAEQADQGGLLQRRPLALPAGVRDPPHRRHLAAPSGATRSLAQLRAIHPRLRQQRRQAGELRGGPERRLQSLGGHLARGGGGGGDHRLLDG